jgi:hypothetical protein
VVVVLGDFGEALVGDAAAPRDVAQERQDVTGTFRSAEGDEQDRVVSLLSRVLVDLSVGHWAIE